MQKANAVDACRVADESGVNAALLRRTLSHRQMLLSTAHDGASAGWYLGVGEGHRIVGRERKLSVVTYVAAATNTRSEFF